MTQKIAWLLIVGCLQVHALDRVSVGKVLKLRGKVVLKESKDEKRVAKKDSLIFQDTVILTGKKSFVKIQMQDDTKITLAANSKLKIAKYRSVGKRDIIYNFIRGKVRAHFHQKAKKGRHRADPGKTDHGSH